MVRQPPKLLTRVIRAIAKLHEEQGSTVPSIVTQVRIALSNGQEVVRNLAMQVRRALKHAVDNGLIIQRAGKFRVAGKRRIIPVDSLEMQVDCRRKRTKKQKKQCACGRRISQQDYPKRHRSPQSGRTTRRKRQKREKSRESGKSQKKKPSRTGSEKSAAQESQHEQQHEQQQQQQEPDNQNNMSSRSRSRSPRRDRTNSNSDVDGRRQDLRGSPYPDSGSDAASSTAENRRRGRPPRRRRAPMPPPNRNNQEGPPTVEDEPIDSPPIRRSIPRNISPKRPSVPRHRENNPDEVRNSDSLDENHEH